MAEKSTDSFDKSDKGVCRLNWNNDNMKVAVEAVTSNITSVSADLGSLRCPGRSWMTELIPDLMD